MESVSNKKRKRTRDEELNTERNAYYKKLRREQKKKRIKRKNESKLKQPESLSKETKKGEATQRPQVATECKKSEETNFLPRELNVRKDETSRGMMMVSAALKVTKQTENNKETVRKVTEIAPNRPPPQALRGEKPSLNVTDVTELKNVKRITGAKAIGSGTFGTCYPGTFRQYRVVIKEYKARDRTSDEYRSFELLKRQAIREARVIKQLGDHPGIPWLFGLCTVKMPVSIVLKFHGDGDGDESCTVYKAAKGKKITEKKKWNEILLETLDALEHIHKCGYAHNDLKSNNVVLEKREDEKLHPVIIDFGNSVLLKKAKAPVPKPKHVRDSYKNSYIAPELVDGTGKPSIESDVYSLAFLIKSVYGILKFGNVDVSIKNALAKSPKNRPPISVLKVALSADN